MDDAEAVPTPFFDKYEANKTETEESLEEKTDFELIVDNNYVYTATKKGKTIIFRVQNKENIIPVNYELVYDSNDMNKLSKIFMLCSNMDEVYHILVGSLKDNKKDIKIEIINEKAICKFILDYKVLDKKENHSIILNKKKSDLKVETINDEFIKFSNKQKSLEIKLEEKVNEINLIKEKQNKLQEEFEKKLKEIDEIKKTQNEFLNYINENKNKFIENEKFQNNIKSELDGLKNGMEQYNNNIPNNKEEIEGKLGDIRNLIKNQKNEMLNSLQNQNKDINNLSIISKELKKSIDKVNFDINRINENQKQRQLFLKIDDKYELNRKIEALNLNTKNSIKEIIEENKNMKMKINELTDNYNLLKNKINATLEKNDKKPEFDDMNLQKIKIDEEKEMKDAPTKFKFMKTISKDIFKKNFYNNRACIFISYTDKKAYIAFGESSLNLEGYDIKNEVKFTIYRKLHENNFDSCRYFYDEKNERDLIITASLDSHVKIIKFNRNLSTIIFDLNFKESDKVIINTAYFLNDIILIPISNKNNGTLAFYNFNKEYISEIQNVGFVLGLNTYTDSESNNNYILIANTIFVLAYNIEKSSFIKFIPEMTPEEKKNNGFDEPYIIKRGKKSLIIGPCFYHPYLYVWDFFNGDLIHKITTSSGISDICLWNNFYAFAGMVRKSQNIFFVLIDIDKGEIVKEFENRIDNGCAGIKIINHENEKYLITSSLNGNLDLYSY